MVRVKNICFEQHDMFSKIVCNDVLYYAEHSTSVPSRGNNQIPGVTDTLFETNKLIPSYPIKTPLVRSI